MIARPRHLVAELLFALLAVALALPHAARADAVTGAISGHVTTSAAAACVLVLGPTGQAVATTATDGSGRYVLDGVPTGRWVVEFVPDDGCLGPTPPTRSSTTREQRRRGPQRP